MSIKIFLHFGIDNGYIFSKGINYSVRDRLLLPKLDIIYNTFLLIFCFIDFVTTMYSETAKVNHFLPLNLPKL